LQLRDIDAGVGATTTAAQGYDFRRRSATTGGRYGGAVAPPVVLVHGWAGSFASTWQSTGFTELLRDAGRSIIGIDLLGHGTAPKPNDPAEYHDLTARVVESLPDEPVDAIGFSLGAITLLDLAVREPQRFGRLVLAGIGESLFDPDTVGTERIIAALEGRGDPDDNVSRMFVQYANQPGNDLDALLAAMKRPRQPIRPEMLATVTCPTLVIIGDRDFAGSGAPLAAALPNATLRTLRNVDHFALPESFGFIDATLAFIDAVPL
jgi:pimeloyl-ACP methyl ester carboxylesterase